MEKALVIVPTYNEKENIEALIEAVLALRKKFDLLVVDDHSPDGTLDIIRALQQRHNSDEHTRIHLIVREKKMGLGTAYIAGFRYALRLGYDYILEMDADFSHNPKDLVRLWEACATKGYDLAIGSRYITGVNVINWSIKRVLLSYFASVYVRAITRMPIRDATAGFVCYRKEALTGIPLQKVRLVGYGFQIEMKFWIWKKGFAITEIPIVFTERTRGTSKLSMGIFREALLGVVHLALRGLFGSIRKKEESRPRA